MFKGTPGPWVIEVGTIGGPMILGGGHLSIVSTVSGSRFDETTEANAILIAAAPELLAAMNDALESGDDGDWQSARNYLTNALAKATGIQP